MAGLAATVRRVLGPALAVLALALLVGLGDARSASTNPQVRLAGGGPEVVFDWSEQACTPAQSPDLPVRAFRDYRGRVQLLLSHFDNFRMVGPTLDRLRVDCDPVMLSHRSPSVRRYEDREWIASLFTRDGKTIWALVHDEYQGNRHRGRCPSGSYYMCWYNAITLARSVDGGRSYRHARPPRHLVAAAPHRYRSGGGPVGVFAPSNIVSGSDGSHYALARFREPGGERGACLLRTPRVQRPGRWRAWTGDGFDGVFTDPYRSKPRPRGPCAQVGRGRIAEMTESLTYNSVLGAYLLVGLAPPGPESVGPKVGGIYFSTSGDLVNWSPRKLLTRAVTPQGYSCGGPPPIAYPSLIDPQSPSRTFATTGAHPYLYYTQFHYLDCRKTPDRNLVRVALEISP
jgi:hypothetical protein